VALASKRFFQEAKIPVMNNVATGSLITQQPADQPEYLLRNAARRQYSGSHIEEAIVCRSQRKCRSLPTPPTTASSVVQTWNSVEGHKYHACGR
jgi:hypothetical protein